MNKQTTQRKDYIGININNYTIEYELGRGYSSVVYQATHPMYGMVAIKVISHEFMDYNSNHGKQFQFIQTQLRILQQSKDNKNIVCVKQIFIDSMNFYIVTQYCSEGTLSDYICKEHRLSEVETIKIMKQILNGFYGLHQVGAMHLDFKAQNILMQNGHAKIADLGFAKQMAYQYLTNTMLGTSLNKAPEVLQRKPYGYKADIWSLGVVFYQMLYGCWPFIADNQVLLMSLINERNGKPDFTQVKISPEVRSFLERCLTIEPQDRISWAQIFSHPIFYLDFNSANAQNLPRFDMARSLTQQQASFYNHNKQFDRNIDMVQMIKNVRVKNYLFISAYEKIVSEELTGTDNPCRSPKQKENNKGQNMFDKPSFLCDRQKIEKMIKKAPPMQHSLQNVNIPFYSDRYKSVKYNILFAISFMVPYAIQSFEIKANHQIALFILLKKSFHTMQQFHTFLTRKNNFMGFPQEQFRQFASSREYEQIANQAKHDLQMLQRQAKYFRDRIQNCAEDIRKEFNIRQIKSDNFDQIAEKGIDEYWNLLAQNLDNCRANQKYFIRLILALEHIKGIVSCRIFNNQMKKIQFF